MEDLLLQASSSSSSGNDDDSSASSSASYADASILLCTLPDSSAASSCSGAPGAVSSVDPGVTGYGADIGLEPWEEEEEEVAAALGRQQTLETLSSDVARQDLGFCSVKRSRVSLSGNLEGNLDVEGKKDEKFLDQSLEIRKKSRGNSTPNQKKEKIRSGNSEQNLAVEAKDSSREESMEKILQDIFGNPNTAPRSSPVCRKLPASICKLPSEKDEEEEEEESTSSESEISIRSPPRGADSGYPNNLQEAIEMLSENFEHFDDKLNDMDILEIVSMRGVVFPISDWWPPRGYSKP
ncbi:uncharacterized protein [Typha angustifolia]|uniref:uncharacterized protein n=1 Tax=Typha angustifolia TaxID=59011 RepID=UPI003C2B6923